MAYLSSFALKKNSNTHLKTYHDIH